MQRPLVRFFAVLLLPCLIGDPSTAFAFSRLNTHPSAIRIRPSLPLINEQALIARIIGARFLGKKNSSAPNPAYSELHQTLAVEPESLPSNLENSIGRRAFILGICLGVGACSKSPTAPTPNPNVTVPEYPAALGPQIGKKSTTVTDEQGRSLVISNIRAEFNASVREGQKIRIVFPGSAFGAGNSNPFWPPSQAGKTFTLELGVVTSGIVRYSNATVYTVPAEGSLDITLHAEDFRTIDSAPMPLSSWPNVVQINLRTVSPRTSLTFERIEDLSGVAAFIQFWLPAFRSERGAIQPIALWGIMAGGITALFGALPNLHAMGTTVANLLVVLPLGVLAAYQLRKFGFSKFRQRVFQAA